MELLYVAEGVPTRDPVHGDGSSLISYEVIRHLPQDVRITLVAFGSRAEVAAPVAERCERLVVLPLRSVRMAEVRSVVSSLSIGAQQRRTRRARRTVRRLSCRADVTLVHGPHAAELSHRVRGPLVLQVVDPWSLRCGMDALLVRGWRRTYRRLRSALALRAERRLPARARLLTVGRRDAHRWSELLGRPVRSIPNGTRDGLPRGERPPGRPPTVCFIGSLNYQANVDSVRILVREVAPRLWQKMPEARVVLAGRHPGPEVLALAGDRVEVLPNVASMQDVFDRADLAVFPDRYGLGMRNSLTEALAAGLPVVATPQAAREQQGHELLRTAEDPGALADLAHDVLVAALSGCGSVTSGGGQGTRIRSWEEATSEYLDELRRAAAGG